jgi:hypothetical protein
MHFFNKSKNIKSSRRIPGLRMQQRIKICLRPSTDRDHNEVKKKVPSCICMFITKESQARKFAQSKSTCKKWSECALIQDRWHFHVVYCILRYSTQITLTQSNMLQTEMCLFSDDQQDGVWYSVTLYSALQYFRAILTCFKFMHGVCSFRKAAVKKSR